MLSTKFTKKSGGGGSRRVSSSSGGIPSSSLPSSRRSNDIKSSSVVSTSKGRAAVGTLSNQVARVAANIPAKGQPRGEGAKAKSGSVQQSGMGGGRGNIKNLGKFGWPGSTKGLKGKPDL